MAEDERRAALDVIGPHVGDSFHGCLGLGGVEQVDAAARGTAQDELALLAGCPDDVNHVLADGVVHVHRSNGCLGLDELGQSDHHRHGIDGVGNLLTPEDVRLGVAAGIAEGDSGKEPVELSLWQRVRARHLNVVLSGQDKEGARQRTGGAVAGNLPLFHGFQKRGLSLGRGAVDLVYKDNVGEQGSGPELELTRVLQKNAGARNVGWQEVRGELDSPELASYRSGYCLGEGRLSDPWHVFDKEVPPTKKGQHRLVYRFGLAFNDSVDFDLNGMGQLLDIYRLHSLNTHLTSTCQPQF